MSMSYILDGLATVTFATRMQPEGQKTSYGYDSKKSKHIV